MRESENSEGVLERYEVPAMRVVPTACGRIVSESFVGDTGSLGVFGEGGGMFWNGGDLDGGLNGLGEFGDGGGMFWNGGDLDGGLNGLGEFGDGGGEFWNAAAAIGGLGEFGPVAGQEWNAGSASDCGVGGFGQSGVGLSWSDSPEAEP